MTRVPIILSCLYDLLLAREQHDDALFRGVTATIDYGAAAELWPATPADENIAVWCMNLIRGDAPHHPLDAKDAIRATEIAVARRLADVACSLSLRDGWAEEAAALWEAARRLCGFKDRPLHVTVRGTSPNTMTITTTEPDRPIVVTAVSEQGQPRGCGFCSAWRGEPCKSGCPLAESSPKVGDVVLAEYVPPGSVVEHGVETVTVRHVDGDGADVGELWWPWDDFKFNRCRILATGLTEAECREAAAMTANEARAWCARRYAIPGAVMVSTSCSRVGLTVPLLEMRDREIGFCAQDQGVPILNQYVARRAEFWLPYNSAGEALATATTEPSANPSVLIIAENVQSSAAATLAIRDHAKVPHAD